MSINWNEIREEEFPSLKNMIQLKAAGGSPISTSAYNYLWVFSLLEKLLIV